MATRRFAHCGANAAWALRVVTVVNIIAGLCLVVFGSTVERPVNSAPAVCMILLGVLNWITAIGGFLAAIRFSCCLDIYLVTISVDVVLTLALVAELFTNFDGLLGAIDPSGTGKYGAAQVKQVLTAARVLVPMFLCAHVAALVIALLMRFFIGEGGNREANTNFDEAELMAREQNIAHLRLDVERGGGGNTTGSSKYNKLMARMSKYNTAARIKFTKKGWFSW